MCRVQDTVHLGMSAVDLIEHHGIGRLLTQSSHTNVRPKTKVHHWFHGSKHQTVATL